MQNPETKSNTRKGKRVLRISVLVAGLFFLIAIALTPRLGSSLGMPWPDFFLHLGCDDSRRINLPLGVLFG
jgi:hypothetical protein